MRLARMVALLAGLLMIACDDEDGASPSGDADATSDTADTADVGADPDAADSGQDPVDDTPDLSEDIALDADTGDATDDPDVIGDDTGDAGTFTAEADPIATDVATPGTTQVESDAVGALTYAVVEAPAHGQAEVSSTGLVTFTPSPDALMQADGTIVPYPWEATDSVTVGVTDANDTTVEVEIGIAIGLADWPQLPPPLDESQCAGDSARYVLTSITPEPGTALTSGTDRTFTFEISYYIPEAAGAQDIGLAREGGDPDDQIVESTEPGCGTTEVTGTLDIADTLDQVVLQQVPAGSASVTYPIDGALLNTLVFSQVTLPPGTSMDRPSFEIGALVDIAWAGEDPPANAFDRSFSLYYDAPSGQNDYWGHSVLPSAGDVPVVLRGVLQCDQTEVDYFLRGTSNAGLAADHHLVFQVEPPDMAIRDFIDGYPVAPGISSTLTGFGIDDCSGVGDVTLAASDDWFTLSVTDTTLPIEDLEITFDGEAFADGDERLGSITVTPDDDAFAPLVIPVRAVGRAFDPELFEEPVLLDNDDAFATVALPFMFPVEGAQLEEVTVSSNGLLGLGACPDPAINDHFDGFWDAIEPDVVDCPVVAVAWADMTFEADPENEAPAPGVYYRSVEDAAGDYVEIVWWNFGAYGPFRHHFVIVAKLFEDGSMTVDYPLTDWRAFETVGWFHSDGSAGAIVVPHLGIGDGHHIDIAPIEALE